MVAAKVSFRQLLSLLPPDEPIKVESYAGYREEERPRRLILGEKVFWIDEILERKRILSRDEADWVEVFICLVEGDRVRLEREASGKWRVKLAEG